ncbi:uncharacterized protein LOC113765664 isoform X1 [Coffea eugenioides]|uniref:uncharacterized protein LOC113765664 isoform X1 n=2 Tax=Coffea eugenioides TaxID=49369 RepID=UPI000F6134F6|nr:uncharacterized protein LOC113765664 isoform X1 [Coffea eugenioides]
MNLPLLHTSSFSATLKRCRINVYKFTPPKIISRSVSSRRRHHRRRLLKHHPDADHRSPPTVNQNLQIVLTVDRLSSSKPVTYISELVDASQSKLSRFIYAADDAFENLRTLVTVDGATKRVVVSCRRSTVHFLGFVLLSSLVIIFVFRVLIKLLIGNSDSFSENNGGVIYRRDRSLGGREVAVAKVDTNFRKNENKKKGSENNILMLMLESENEIKRPFWERRKKRSAEKLPQWWPVSSQGPGLLVENKEEYQMMANRLIQAIMDKRIRGEDISMDDIVQLRRICRISGVRVLIEVENARDSIYRASVDFVLQCCERIENQSAFINIDGEDVHHFIAGLAENIGLENSRASRMVSAAVAARTRSRFLQAWALKIQGNHSEAVAELLKICLIHKIFPPEESSAEMEMVARGLEKQLNVDQRELLLNMLIRTCGEGTRRSMTEALGLIQPPQSDVEQEKRVS